jgi:hypothetical protein
MPSDRAVVSLKIRASYSAILLVALKLRQTAYLSCSPSGDRRTTPAPQPWERAEPLKNKVQWGPVKVGAGALGSC